MDYHTNHLNAMYDLCNKLYLDKNTIIMADRGYEHYNVIAHIQ